MKQFFKGTGLAIGLLIAVYVPAFLITALIRPSIAVAVPMVIVISFGVCFAIIVALARRPEGLAEFGFRLPQAKYVWWCLGIGAVFGLIAGYATYLFPTRPPYDVSKFAPVCARVVLCDRRFRARRNNISGALPDDTCPFFYSETLRSLGSPRQRGCGRCSSVLPHPYSRRPGGRAWRPRARPGCRGISQAQWEPRARNPGSHALQYLQRDLRVSPKVRALAKKNVRCPAPETLEARGTK